MWEIANDKAKQSQMNKRMAKNRKTSKRQLWTAISPLYLEQQHQVWDRRFERAKKERQRDREKTSDWIVLRYNVIIKVIRIFGSKWNAIGVSIRMPNCRKAGNQPHAKARVCACLYASINIQFSLNQLFEKLLQWYGNQCQFPFIWKLMVLLHWIYRWTFIEFLCKHLLFLWVVIRNWNNDNFDRHRASKSTHDAYLFINFNSFGVASKVCSVQGFDSFYHLFISRFEWKNIRSSSKLFLVLFYSPNLCFVCNCLFSGGCHITSQ